MMHPQWGCLCDVEEIGIEADEFCVVMKGDGGDEKIEGAGCVAQFAAAAAEIGGIAPESRRRGEQGKRGEPRFELPSFGWCGVAQDLECHRFAQAGAFILQPR